MDDRIWGIIVILMWLIPVPGGIWYIVNPKSVRDFHKKRPYYDRYGKMCKSPDWEIRVKGFIILLICVACAGTFLMLFLETLV